MDSALIFWLIAAGVALVVGFVVWSMCRVAARELRVRG